MVSKYLSFWASFFNNKGGVKKVLDELQSIGYLHYDITNIRSRGERNSWYGKVNMTKNGISSGGEMVHVNALKNLIPEFISDNSEYNFKVFEKQGSIYLEISRDGPSKKQDFSLLSPKKPGSSLDYSILRIQQFDDLISYLENLPIKKWPDDNIPLNGIYLFYEKGEKINGKPRIVRVGINTEDGNFKKRIHSHYKGSHKNSVFRKHVGYAILGQEGVNDKIRNEWYNEKGKFKDMEHNVDRYFNGSFTYKTIEIAQKNLRSQIEQQWIQLLSFHPKNKPSKTWLGKYGKEPISSSGLWNINHVPIKKINIVTTLENNNTNNQDTNKVKSIFIIGCSAGKHKNVKGKMFKDLDKSDYLFKSLSESRKKMVTYYSNLKQEDSQKTYLGNSLRKSRAWQSNMNIINDTSIPAINRYNGNLYKNLNWTSDLTEKSKESKVLILSAMFGLLDFSDPIPNYELMMNDKSPYENSVKIQWKQTFQTSYFQSEFKKIFPNLQYIYLLLSDSYYSALGPAFKKYSTHKINVIDGGTSNSPIRWGRILNTVLRNKVIIPEEIKKIAKSENSTMF